MRASLSPSRPDRFATFFRSDAEAALVMGTLEQPASPDEGVAFYERRKVPPERIVHDAGGDSFDTIHAFLRDRCAPQRVKPSDKLVGFRIHPRSAVA